MLDPADYKSSYYIPSWDKAQYQTKMLSHFKKTILRKPIKISQSVRKENPRNSPREPPASARNDLEEI